MTVTSRTVAADIIRARTAGQPPALRRALSSSLHTAVWTGDEMIVWGGYDGATEVNTGGRTIRARTVGQPPALLTLQPRGTRNGSVDWQRNGRVGWRKQQCRLEHRR